MKTTKKNKVITDKKVLSKESEALNSMLYKNIGLQDVEIGKDYWISVNPNFYYKHKVKKENLEFSKKMAEEKKLFVRNQIDTIYFKSMLERNIPLNFIYRNKLITVLPPEGFFKKKVFVDGIEQYQLHSESTLHKEWFDFFYDEPFSLDWRYFLGLDKPEGKPTNVLYNYFHNIMTGDVSTLYRKQEMSTNLCVYRWNVKLNKKYNTSKSTQINVITNFEETSAEKICKKYKVNKEDVELVGQYYYNDFICPNLWMDEILIEIGNFYRYTETFFYHTHEELLYLINISASEKFDKIRVNDTKYTLQDVKWKSCGRFYQINPALKTELVWYVFRLNPRIEILEDAKKISRCKEQDNTYYQYTKKDSNNGSLKRKYFIVSIQALSEEDAIGKLEDKYPFLLQNKEMAELIDTYRSAAFVPWFRRVYITLRDIKHNEDILSKWINFSMFEPIEYYFAELLNSSRNLLKYKNRKKEDFILQVLDKIAVNKYSIVGNSLVEKTIKLREEKRYFPVENYKGSRKLRRISLGKRKTNSSSKGVIVVPIRKYEPNETEEVKITLKYPKFKYQKKKIFFKKDVTLENGTRIRKYDTNSYILRIERKFDGFGYFDHTYTRKVKPKYKGIRVKKK